MQAEMCKETVLVPELCGEGFNITVFEPGTRNTSIQEKRSHCCHCADYSPPHEAGDKTAAVRRSEGRGSESKGCEHTHTHQNSSSVLQTTVLGAK